MSPRRPFPLGSVIALAALAAALRLAFAWFPNVSPAFLVVFVAGVALGPLAGASVGALAMLVTNLFLSGVHPVMLVNTPAMALVGVLGAAAAAVVNLGQRPNASPVFTAVVAGSVGFFLTLLFSVLADGFTYLLFYPRDENVLEALVALGLAFNALPAVANGLLFGAGARPVLNALRHAGLIRWRPWRAAHDGAARGKGPREVRAG